MNNRYVNEVLHEICGRYLSPELIREARYLPNLVRYCGEVMFMSNNCASEDAALIRWAIKTYSSRPIPKEELVPKIIYKDNVAIVFENE